MTTSVKSSKNSWRWIAGALVALFCFTSAKLSAQERGKLREPLPFDVALSLLGHNGRSPVDLSPDGEWVAHTIETDETVPRDSISRFHSATGFPFAEGDSRMEATLTNTRTGEVVRLGGPNSASWAAVWSPDGSRVAFYSDEGGEAGLWVWEKATGKATRFPGVITRPFFGFEMVRWTSDGRRLLVKILPLGMTIAEANAIGGRLRSGASTRFPEVAPGEPSVLVRRSEPGNTRLESQETATVRQEPVGDMSGWNADLAILDLQTQSVTRLVSGTPVRFYAFSPDERYVAYTVLKGAEPNTQQPNFDMAVYELATGAKRTLSTNIRLAYGIEWSWSPDSRRIAYVETGQLGDGGIVLVSITDGNETKLAREGVPSFDPGDGEYPPLWDEKGENLYGVGDGALWRVSAASGRGTQVGAIEGWRIRSMVTRPERPTVWSPDGGRTMWVVARERGGAQAGIYAIDITTGEARAVLQESKSYSAIFNLDASDVTGEFAFVSTGQHHLREIWMFGTRDRQVRRASRLNPELDRYELGEARVIEWETEDGQALAGSLLLPPGYRAGQRVPLVVWVYGGSMGSNNVNRFGLVGIGAFNMQLLATRGYAVLFPDAPLREGKPVADLMRTVMPGVDAAIEQGYADPDRLAIMGQSYGSLNTLAIITQTTRFKAAVITAAVLHPDLFAAYLGSAGYYEQGQGNMGGTIWEYHDRYLENSPLFLFDRIETPLLIGQGERDGDLVPSEAIFAALERLGKNVEYRLYEAEGHVITQKPNLFDFWKRRLDFLAEHLELEVDEKGAIIATRN